MVARPAAVPRSKDPQAPASHPGDAQFEISGVGIPSDVAAVKAAKEDLPALDFSGFVFSESSPDFQIEADVDPVDAEAEEAAILYANGQDEVARSVLENAVRIHQFGPGERLWLMLFDLYRLMGRKTEFEALEIDYARSFEKSPPTWKDRSKVGAKLKEAVAGSLLFKGELKGENHAAFDTVRQALEKNPRLRLDLSKVAQLDAAGCSSLLAVLKLAKKDRRDLELLGRDGLCALLEKRVEPGRAEESECWLLLLELCQLQGRHEAFDDLAINYAVTFEVSPPSWEPERIAAPEPVLQLVADDVSADVVAGDVYPMRGDVKASRFLDFPAYYGDHDPVLIDCSGLTRMDFISAGALLNVLTTAKRAGKQIVLRHPNHLVAELFCVVGLDAMATIIFSNK